MLLRPEQLAGHLDKGLAGLYVLHGDEPLLVIEAGDAIRAAARRRGFEEREVLVATPNWRWDELFLAGGNMSLFGGSKLVDLRIPSGKPGRDGGEALQRYAREMADVPGMLTLVTLPQLEWQARKAAWFTALAEAGVSVECNAPPLRDLPDWIAAVARAGRSLAFTVSTFSLRPSAFCTSGANTSRSTLSAAGTKSFQRRMCTVFACANSGARCVARIPASPVAATPAPVALRNFLRFISFLPLDGLAAVAAATAQSAFVAR